MVLTIVTIAPYVETCQNAIFAKFFGSLLNIEQLINKLPYRLSGMSIIISI